jgi:hypothetical protein
MIKTVTRV